MRLLTRTPLTRTPLTLTRLTLTRLTLAGLALASAGACPIVAPPFTPIPPRIGVPPVVVCPPPIEAVDTAGATVIGDGTPASCSEQALDAALAAHNGALVFDCGGPVVIPITSEKVISQDLVIDGARDVTLDGQDLARILRIDSSFERDTPHVIVQHLTFVRGHAEGSDLEGGGAAIARTGGSLDVIDCAFIDNHGNVDGQDTQGGAIYAAGGGATTVVGSSFTSNSCSDGGALGALNSDLVVVNSDFASNEATGNGGNPGNGGNGGTIYVDGNERSLTMCGVRIEDSLANAFGGAVFRIGYQFTEPTNIDRVVIDGAAIEDVVPSMAGGLYLQGTVVTMTATTIMNSSAVSAGGAYFGPGSTLHLANVSFLDNTASSGLGGGVFLDGTLGGDIVNCTFAGNRAAGELSFGGAIVGSGAGVSLRNSLILDSFAGNGFNPVSCTTALEDGSGCVQFPVARSGGGTDDPAALCAASVRVEAVALGPIEDGGDVPVRAPLPDSPALGLGSDCPARDALGRARAQPCTAGAVEVALP